MKKVSTAKLVLFNESQEVLLGRRTTAPTEQFRAGKLELFGGELEPGESARDAIHREVYEESGITPDQYVIKRWFKRKHDSQHGHRNIRHCFVGQLIIPEAEVVVVLSPEHDFACWQPVPQAISLVDHPVQRQIVIDAAVMLQPAILYL